MESSEPWQTYTACVEIRNALNYPGGPQNYVSHLPIHQVSKQMYLFPFLFKLRTGVYIMANRKNLSLPPLNFVEILVFRGLFFSHHKGLYKTGKQNKDSFSLFYSYFPFFLRFSLFFFLPFLPLLSNSPL